MSGTTKTAKTAPKAPLQLDTRFITKLTVTLLGICVVVALLLGIVNYITAPIIAAAEKAKQDAAMAQVLPADSYEKVGFTAANVPALYIASSGGTQIGWVAETSTSGSQGIIQMMVGVDMDGRVTGVSVVSSSETPNIGSKVVGDQSVLDRFIGMSHADGEITVNSGTNRFDGITGATVSSRGVAAGVNAALAAIGVS